MNQLQIINGYSNPQFEEKIESLQQEYLVFNLYAKQDSEQNKPSQLEYWKSRVYNSVQMQAEAVFNFLQQVVQPVSAATRRIEVQEASQKQIVQLHADINFQQVNLHKIEQSIQECPTYSVKTILNKLVVLFLVLAGLADCFLTVDAFRGGGLSFIAALLYGIPAGLAVALGAAFAASNYRRAKAKSTKRLTILAITAASLIFFFILGFLRSSLYRSRPDIGIASAVEITSPSAISINGWELAMISFILFIAGFCFKLATAQTEKEQIATARLQKLLAEQKALKDSIKQKEECIKKLEEDTLTEVILCTKQCEYAISAKKRIANIAKATLADYAATNIALRTDGQIPAYLTEIPDIIFHQ